MPPDSPSAESTQLELTRLRVEHTQLAELLQVDRAALRNFMAYAARTLTRVRTLLAQRAREPEQFIAKLGRLHSHYTQLLRQATALPMPTLARSFEQTLQALDAARGAAVPSGDALLPALVCIDEVFLALSTIAQRSGVPLAARRAPRRRNRLARPLTAALRGVAPAGSGGTPQLLLALQQLAAQQAAAQGKSVELTAIGLEQVPEIHVAAFYDMLSQMLRNAIEHGIETPAQRRAAGKNPQGALLVEFQPRHGGLSELVFQDDGQGLNTARIIEAAAARSLVTDEAALEQDPRRATTLIFHAGLSTAADATGRGLGMRILRDNVKRLDGQIQVATKRGQFTRIRIRLPSLGASASEGAAAQG
ncbi:MAG TPA: ATP-binding protein [Steroidobacteraceae bacterium]|nr:ATP-binding protein [Steroidobacteraceae bacterium]